MLPLAALALSLAQDDDLTTTGPIGEQWRQSFATFEETDDRVVDVVEDTAGERVFVLALAEQSSWVVAAVDRNSGAELWSELLTGEMGAEGPRAIAFSPVADAVFAWGTFVVEGGERPVAVRFDATSGARAWTATPGSWNLTTVDIAASADGMRVYALSLGTLFALDAAGGATLWYRTLTEAGMNNAVELVPAGGSVIVAANAYSCVGLLALDGATGEPRWFQSRCDWPDQWHASDVDIAADGTRVFLSASRSAMWGGPAATELLAYDVTTGIELWSRRLGRTPSGDVTSRVATSANGSEVAVLSTVDVPWGPNFVRLTALSASDGALRLVHDSNPGPSEDVALALVAGRDGATWQALSLRDGALRLTAVDTATGSPRWALTPDGSTPAALLPGLLADSVEGPSGSQDARLMSLTPHGTAEWTAFVDGKAIAHSGVETTALSPGGQRIAFLGPSGSHALVVGVADALTGEVAWHGAFPNPPDTIRLPWQVAFTSDGSGVLTGSVDVVGPPTNLGTSSRGHDARTGAVAWDHLYLLPATVPSTFEPVILSSPHGLIGSSAQGPPGHAAFVARRTLDGTIQWEMSFSLPDSVQSWARAPVSSPDGHRLYAVATNVVAGARRYLVRQLAFAAGVTTWETVYDPGPGKQSAEAVVLSPDETRLYIVDLKSKWDGTEKVRLLAFDAVTGAPLPASEPVLIDSDFELLAAEHDPLSPVIYLVVQADEPRALAFDTESGMLLWHRSYEASVVDFRDGRVTADGRSIVVSGSDAEARMHLLGLDTSTGDVVFEATGPPETGTGGLGLALDAHGSLAWVAASADMPREGEGPFAPPISLATVHAFAIGGAALSAPDEAAPGDTVLLRNTGAEGGSFETWLSPASTAVPVPPHGLLAIGPTPLFRLLPLQPYGAGGESTTQLQVPLAPELAGVELHLQSVALLPATGGALRAVLSNSQRVLVR